MKHKIYKKVVLIIIDGFGVAPSRHGNAIAQARIPTIDSLIANYPSMSLQASGPLVGLPWGEMGNSEVGHLNMGAGRIVGQDLGRITNTIRSGEFFKNPVFLEAIKHSQKYNSALHLMGLVSGGGVHSLDEHLYALLAIAAQEQQRKVYIHMFTDGRDTEPKAALDSAKKLHAKIEEIGVGKIATVTGRFYAMDRGAHWNQTALTYKALTEGVGETAVSAEQCIQANYSSQIFDEMIQPTVITDSEGKPVVRISDNDAVIFFNFRSDRALQLTQMFIGPADVPKEFGQKPLQNLYFATMTEYRQGLPVHAAFPPMDLRNNLAEILSKKGLTQFHIAESEKYAHVTAFFNCGMTEKLPGEERVIVTSPENARNYVNHPEMSAEKLTETLTKKIAETDVNFFVANYANPDMVGHTGNLRAAVEAVEFIDQCLKKVSEASLKAGAVLMITSDHGNVEQMLNPRTGEIDTDHTTNPVPFLFISEENKFFKSLEINYLSLSARIPAGVIGDIAPTILDLFGLEKPAEMTGINLLDSIDEIPKKM